MDRKTCYSTGCEIATVGGCDKKFCSKLLQHHERMMVNAIKVLDKNNWTIEEIDEVLNMGKPFIIMVLEED